MDCGLYRFSHIRMRAAPVLAVATSKLVLEADVGSLTGVYVRVDDGLRWAADVYTSGVDARSAGPAVWAAADVAMALVKNAMRTSRARRRQGRVAFYVAAYRVGDLAPQKI